MGVPVFGSQRYQMHHCVITSETDVQIYEELVRDGNDQFTTSFIHRDEEVKDNRLLPKGWSANGPDVDSPTIREFIEATYPHLDAESPYSNDSDCNDSIFTDGSGSDVVRYRVALPAEVDVNAVTVQATLYSQSIPPYYLRQRFTLAPRGPATQRFYYLASHLDLEGTPLEDWKLEIASATRRLVGR